MLEEIQRRNYSHRTARTYVRIVRDFAEYFHQSPDKLGPEQIRQYQAHLFQAKNLAPGTVSQYVSALRFLFVKTLRRQNTRLLWIGNEVVVYLNYSKSLGQHHQPGNKKANQHDELNRQF